MNLKEEKKQTPPSYYSTDLLFETSPITAGPLRKARATNIGRLGYLHATSASLLAVGAWLYIYAPLNQLAAALAGIHLFMTLTSSRNIHGRINTGSVWIMVATTALVVFQLSKLLANVSEGPWLLLSLTAIALTVVQAVTMALHVRAWLANIITPSTYR